jgi:pyruvate dehydrogenase E1 component alpha subunit
MKFNKIHYLKLFDMISSIRICEELIHKYYNQNEMKTPMHMSRGEELVVSAAVKSFGKSSKYFGYYRSHALYLSLIGDIKSFFGEMFGRKSGENSGITGSMHILNPKKNLMSISAIVASTISPAIGASYASLLNKKKYITVSFFGDGATEQGVFHEALNFSSLKKLPIAFVCLNNDLAVDVKIKERQSYSIKKLVQSYKIKYFKISSFEIDNVCQVYDKAKKYIIKYRKPVFIEAFYYRHLQHIGLLTDFENTTSSFERTNYRSLIEHKKKLKKDPYILIKKIINKKCGEKFCLNLIKKKEVKIKKIVENVRKNKLTNFKEILIN